MSDPQQINRFSPFTQRLLAQAGWFSGRDVLAQVRLAKGFELTPTAAVILQEFGNLRVGERGPGIECAQSIIVFEPRLADYENDRFSEWSEVIQSDLYPLGETDNGLFFLAIDQHGHVYRVMAQLLLIDTNFDRALEKLLKGFKGTPVDDN